MRINLPCKAPGCDNLYRAFCFFLIKFNKFDNSG